MTYCHKPTNPKPQHPKKHFCWLPKNHEGTCLNYNDSKEITDVNRTGVAEVFTRIGENKGTQEDFQEAMNWLHYRTNI